MRRQVVHSNQPHGGLVVIAIPMINQDGTQYGVLYRRPTESEFWLNDKRIFEVLDPDEDCQCDQCRGISSVWDQQIWDIRPMPYDHRGEDPWEVVRKSVYQSVRIRALKEARTFRGDWI